METLTICEQHEKLLFNVVHPNQRRNKVYGAPVLEEQTLMSGVTLKQNDEVVSGKLSVHTGLRMSLKDYESVKKRES